MAKSGHGNAHMPSSTLPLSSPSGKGLAKGRDELVEKSVLEDGPERTISVWREHVAGGTDGEGRSDLDSHVGHRRVSADSLRRVESLTRVGSVCHGESQLEGQGALQQRIRRVHGGKSPIPSLSSPDMTKLINIFVGFLKISHSTLQSNLPARSATPQVATNADAYSPQPTNRQKSQRRAPASTVQFLKCLASPRALLPRRTKHDLRAENGNSSPGVCRGKWGVWVFQLR